MTPYTLPQIEDLAYMKGVVRKSCKEILEELESEDMCFSERLGTTVFYWYFPSTKAVRAQGVIAQLEESVQSLKESVQEAGEKKEELLKERVPCDERTERLRLLSEMEEELKEKHNKLKQLQVCDAESHEKTVKNILKAQEGVNRWTDNIFMLQGWISEKFSMEKKLVNKHFQIPKEMDYTEVDPDNLLGKEE
eukprot:TRINITY_DN8768_c0_g1_i1.p1 TRINITY_DN8768_c0_g1~~TRINITY_DN8768_c0_g1_i1.p1  ORF type:complete len:193 (-),score=45.91 TRINITY_DN8768_c0_g1_i1:109-687(-)